MFKTHEFGSYDEYIKTQMQHVNTPYRTVERHINRLTDIDVLKKTFATAKSVLCVGSRDRSEVIDFIDAGYDAIGIDIFSRCDEIRVVDMHDIAKTFAPATFDVAYLSHSLEHSVRPEEVLLGIKQTCKLGCVVVLPIAGAPTPKDPTVFSFMNNAAATVSDVQNDLTDLVPGFATVLNVVHRKQGPAPELVITLVF